MNDRRKFVLKQLLEKGVAIPCPESVEIGPDVDPKRISGQGVTIHAGCRIFGSDTLIMPGVELGYETPVTVDNCQIGKDVRLGGGFFCESCFLDGSAMGSGAQVREACLIEERARGAHTVGLKHTILFPYVTLGSLINFCDCLMAGGTDELNHCEVGSGYIHFNYTPNQDKATASLIGDVPRGVMIRQRPVFLGGQGGMVGPVKISYGTVVGAGNIVRRDILKEDTILISQAAPNLSMPFNPGIYTNIRRIIIRNTDYIANLIALRRWYLDIRCRLIRNDPEEQLLMKGAVDKLDTAIRERIRRLGQVAEKMPVSVKCSKDMSSGLLQKTALQTQQDFSDNWAEMETVFQKNLEAPGNSEKREGFVKIIERVATEHGGNYLAVIRGLTQAEADMGSEWLQGLVDQVVREVMAVMPGFRSHLKPA
ncbi:MAG: hypothetical protein DRH37_10390 [Deltaproteobacteria bacterium]|nr:MAG: hypothetical protein DRH37_10390 [Deltaproteobacteria bacterium]